MEFIITFLIVVFLVAWVAGKIFPFLLKRFLKRKFGIDPSGFEAGMGGGKGGSSTKSYSNYKEANSSSGREKTEEERRVGQVTEIVVTEEREKIIDNDLGEYIEYEEVSCGEKK